MGKTRVAVLRRTLADIDAQLSGTVQFLVVSKDVPDINIGVDQISPDSGDEDTTIDRDVVETVDAVCAPGFGFAQEKESEEFDADLMMAGSQIRSVPVYYRDCEGDDADRLVTFELIDGSDFCELKVANDYTDEDGIAGSHCGFIESTGFERHADDASLKIE